ncbi:MAG: GNAT family N-acetyltransferase [Candidatus Sericytochromatia bacterium]|nr:GNAT family N-acetyltransferase [Candidatus Sericytochromatia bacterium]
MPLREFQMGDIPAIASIRNASVELSPDFFSMTLDRFRYDFYGADLPLTSRIVVAESDWRVVGFYHLYTDERLLAQGRSNLDSIHVAPEQRGSGVGADLMASALNTARGWGARYVSTAIPESSPRSLAFLERHGFERVRRFDLLRLNLQPDLTPPAPLNGFLLRTFSQGDEPRFVAAFNAAFADHWDFVPLDASHVQIWNRRDSFDPEGCLLLQDANNGELAAFVTVLHQTPPEVQPRVARIFEMGVVPAYRRQGLGYHILQQGLAYAASHGFTAVDLVTDAQSEAGLQLYAKVGFTDKRSSIVLHRPVT